MSAVVLKNIEKVYENGFKAVKNFNLEIEDREFIVFVGPSGCGKSTTLRMIAGLEEISEGELYIDGNIVNDVEPKDRDIAMVFQNYALYPHMTVEENMAFSLKLKKVPKEEIKRKVNEAAKVLDIVHLLDRKPKALSGGQRQRVAMGRAIVRNPKVFLMDEPLSNLDAKLRVQMRTEIAKLYNELNTTFIYVTHDQTEAMTLGTRIVVMKDGVVQQIDTPKKIYENPKNLFVAGFIGSPQMNILNGESYEKEGTVYLKILDTEIKLPKEKGEVLKKTNNLNTNLFVGIRPENISCKREDIENKENSVFKLNIEVSENLGAETYLHLKSEDKTIIIKTATADNINTKGLVEFVMDLNKLHVFDKNSEETIF